MIDRFKAYVSQRKEEKIRKEMQNSEKINF